MNLECQVCTGNKIGTSFNSLDDLQAHLFMNHHDGPLDVFQFVCHKCEFKFGTEYRLLRHEEICGRESRSEEDMEKIRYKLQMYELLEVTLKYNMTKHQVSGARPANPSNIGTLETRESPQAQCETESLGPKIIKSEIPEYLENPVSNSSRESSERNGSDQNCSSSSVTSAQSNIKTELEDVDTSEVEVLGSVEIRKRTASSRSAEQFGHRSGIIAQQNVNSPGENSNLRHAKQAKTSLVFEEPVPNPSETHQGTSRTIDGIPLWKQFLLGSTNVDEKQIPRFNSARDQEETTSFTSTDANWSTNLTNRIDVNGPCLHPEQADPKPFQEEEFRAYFGQFGKISSVTVRKNSYATVTFENCDPVIKCMQQRTHKILSQDFIIWETTPSESMKLKLKSIREKLRRLENREKTRKLSCENALVPNNQIQLSPDMTNRILVTGPILHPTEEMHPKVFQEKEFHTYFGQFGKIINELLENLNAGRQPWVSSRKAMLVYLSHRMSKGRKLKVFSVTLQTSYKVLPQLVLSLSQMPDHTMTFPCPCYIQSTKCPRRIFKMIARSRLVANFLSHCAVYRQLNRVIGLNQSVRLQSTNDNPDKNITLKLPPNATGISVEHSNEKSLDGTSLRVTLNISVLQSNKSVPESEQSDKQLENFESKNESRRELMVKAGYYFRPNEIVVYTHSKEISEDALRAYFSQFGEVVRCFLDGTIAEVTFKSSLEVNHVLKSRPFYSAGNRILQPEWMQKSMREKYGHRELKVTKNPAGDRTILIDGLSAEISKDAIQDYFSRFGDVELCRIPFGDQSAYVTFKSTRSVNHVFNCAPHYIIGDRITNDISIKEKAEDERDVSKSTNNRDKETKNKKTHWQLKVTKNEWNEHMIIIGDTMIETGALSRDIKDDAIKAYFSRFGDIYHYLRGEDEHELAILSFRSPNAANHVLNSAPHYIIGDRITNEIPMEEKAEDDETLKNSDTSKTSAVSPSAEFIQSKSSDTDTKDQSQLLEVIRFLTNEKKIMVQALSQEISQDALRAYFSQFGEVVECMSIERFGYVTFKSSLEVKFL
ncbi:DAZ-associated protein 1 [Ditylenchus destructor]|nr:DAZ-associated protein 1 [Ditylenchus destructor]